tara:strand:+ start:18369 stop:20609 length:2241 start_codon:yes stop_codon:yes gene_type:complete
MDTQKNKKINFDIKSQLAKLIATENIQVQHNAVKTASFDTVNRILTLPIFKVQAGDVYDMLIAHECSHALWTPTDGWKKISDDASLRSYVNVLEDCRIDAKIQKKYPGVVKNYINGFDILEKQNFFGTKSKDINTDLMLIDKINLFYKSSKRLPVKFSSVDKLWLSKVNNLSSFTDVVKLAKELLEWQKKEVEKLKKLPDFDEHAFADNYNLSEDEDDMSDESNESSKNSAEDSEESESNDEDKKDTDKTNPIPESKNGGGDGGIEPGTLVAITDDALEQNKEKLVSTSSRGYAYMTLPDAKLKNVIVSNKQFLKEMREYASAEIKKYPNYNDYHKWLHNTYKKFKHDNKRTVMYLVKEFEMKKSATAHKRATTSKTGIIDPQKLKNYKFSDDIFKKLTILPDAKNHGMMMLLDWSGSMCDTLKQTIDQLLNLVWFCDKINIPYEVYFFTSEYKGVDGNRNWENKGKLSFDYKSGDGQLQDVNLVCVANNTMKRKTLDESLMYLYHMGQSYNNRYSWYTGPDNTKYEGSAYDLPTNFHLGTTPLNEGLVCMKKMIPLFKEKYNIEKMTLITLTDGGANYSLSNPFQKDSTGNLVESNKCGTPVIKVGKKSYSDENDSYRRSSVTGILLKAIREQHKVSTIGFYVTKKLKSWEYADYIGDYKNYSDKEKQIKQMKSAMTKERYAQAKSLGYSKYFLLNGKSMQVDNTDLSAIKGDMKATSIKKIFSKSMKNRIVSRTLLNKFVEEVA